MEFLTCKIRSSKNINSFKHKYIEHLKEAYANIDHFQSTCKLFSISTALYNHIFITIGPLHDPFTWYKITHASEQVALPLFWKSHCSTGPTACVILYHVTGSCERGMKQLQVNSVYSIVWHFYNCISSKQGKFPTFVYAFVHYFDYHYETT